MATGLASSVITLALHRTLNYIQTPAAALLRKIMMATSFLVVNRVQSAYISIVHG
jgi:hypothetical protein